MTLQKPKDQKVKFWMEGDTLRIQYKWMSQLPIALVPFLCVIPIAPFFFVGTSHNGVVQSIPTTLRNASFLALIYWPLSYFFLAMGLNSTAITARKDSLEVKTGPIWWNNVRNYKVDDIQQIFLPEYNRYGRRSNSVMILDGDSAIRPLADRIPSTIDSKDICYALRMFYEL